MTPKNRAAPTLAQVPSADKTGRIGVITNPHARAARSQRAWSDPRVHEHVTTRVSELPAALEAMRGCEYLAANGGDGTLGEIITTLALRGEPLPTFIPLFGGTNNAVAKDVGARRGGAIGRVLAGQKQQVVERQTLRVVCGDRERYGFVFSTGLIVRFTEAYYRGAGVGAAKVAWVVAKKIAQVALPFPQARAFWRFESNRVSIDDVPLMLPSGAQLTFVSTLNQQILFFRPFEKRAEEIPGFNVLVNALPSAAIARHFFALVRGTYRGSGHVAKPAEAFTVSGTSRFFLDGELFDCAASDRLTVTPGPRVRFAI